MNVLPFRFLPQLAVLTKAPPEGDDWLHEIKYDGYRIGCRIDHGKATLFSRNNRDWTETFPELRAAAERLPASTAFLDGEVVVLLPDGRTGFQALQHAIATGTRTNLVYYAFDLLFLDGRDLSSQPLEARKERLEDLLRRAPASLIRYSSHVAGRGQAVFAEACRLRLEGLVSKRRDLPYHPGRHDGWVKTKCVSRQEFVVGGFTEPEGRARQGIGALLVGYYDRRKRLIYAGRAGTGFSNAEAVELRKRLEGLSRQTPPFVENLEPALLRFARWVRPELVAEVQFTEWTNEGLIRHPSFQGLREDRRAEDVRREDAAPTPQVAKARTATTLPNHVASKAAAPAQRGRKPAKAAVASAGSGDIASPVAAAPSRVEDPHVAGVRISHPDRVMYPAAGLTKLDVARYYEVAAPWMLPHLAGRPLTLVRCGDGLQTGDMRRDCMYLKHSKVWAPRALRRIRVTERTKVGEYVVADDIEGLLTLVQMDVLEIHTWNSTEAHIEQPDRIVFDIDPGPDVAWREVVETARLVRSLLQSLDLESWVKTTGGKGLHVVVPLVPRLAWDECLDFSRHVAAALARTDPNRYTIAFAKAGRERKLLIDYLRNNRTNTSVAAFSTRARPTAAVSLPIAWEDLSSSLDPAGFTAATLRAPLARRRKDPWAAYWTTRQQISARARKAVAGLSPRV